MKKRVISESINIRINVGNYQHIEITKQAQEEIEYKNEEERLALEEGLSNDLISSVINSMRLVPQRLGKGVDNAQEVEESITKAIPQWFENSPPNLANVPKANSNKVASDQKANKDDFASSVEDIIAEPEVVAVMTNKEVEIAESELGSEKVPEEMLFGDDDLLFLDDESPVEPETVTETVSEQYVREKAEFNELQAGATPEEVKESLSETVTVDKEKKDVAVVSEDDDFDFFDDDDLDLFSD